MPFILPDRQVTETFPQYTIDGVDLTESQCKEYEDLLDDCAGDMKLCQETWKLYHFHDGDQWLTMDALQHLESNEEFMNSLEGEDLDFEDLK